ncbi:hypothetical protein HYS94_04645 [Candidatus Daviesbacteria bacterium]|nr:hypothetical protein [Candidatus Daviesbacteria bacterium]
MGVEGGSIGVGPVGGGSVAVSSGPAAGIRFGGSISAPGGELGSIGSIGPSIWGPESFGGPVNEGPVGIAALENTSALTIDTFHSGGEIMFNPFKEQTLSEPLSRPLESAAEPLVLRQAAEVAGVAWAVSEAEQIISQAQTIAAHAWEYHPITQAENILARVVAEPRQKVIAVPELVLGSAVGVQPAVENKAAQAVSAPITQEQQIEQVVREVFVEDKTDKDQSPKEVEEIEEFRLKDVVDEKVLAKRIDEFGEAIDQAEAEIEGDEEIEGSDIVKFLAPEDEERRSGLIKRRGPDGSRVETMEDIAARKFSSAKEAKKQTVETIYKKWPVKKAKEGREVGFEDKARVLKYQTGESVSNHEAVEKRIVRLVRQAPAESTRKVLVEPTLKDLGLEEVFEKAA